MITEPFFTDKERAQQWANLTPEDGVLVLGALSNLQHLATKIVEFNELGYISTNIKPDDVEQFSEDINRHLELPSSNIEHIFSTAIFRPKEMNMLLADLLGIALDQAFKEAPKSLLDQLRNMFANKNAGVTNG